VLLQEHTHPKNVLESQHETLWLLLYQEGAYVSFQQPDFVREF